jgi:hypothetical protein
MLKDHQSVTGNVTAFDGSILYLPVKLQQVRPSGECGVGETPVCSEGLSSGKVHIFWTVCLTEGRFLQNTAGINPQPHSSLRL